MHRTPNLGSDASSARCFLVYAPVLICMTACMWTDGMNNTLLVMLVNIVYVDQRSFSASHCTACNPVHAAQTGMNAVLQRMAVLNRRSASRPCFPSDWRRREVALQLVQPNAGPHESEEDPCANQHEDRRVCDLVQPEQEAAAPVQQLHCLHGSNSRHTAEHEQSKQFAQTYHSPCNSLSQCG